MTAVTSYCLITIAAGTIRWLFIDVNHVTKTTVLVVVIAITGSCFVLLQTVLLARYSFKRNNMGVFFIIFVPIVFTVCIVAPSFLARSKNWTNDGPVILILGVLTLVNAPFDWFALGLTRALLRRGLELGGIWPYFLALADGVLAALTVAFLVIVMVVAVQAFDTLTQDGGGTSILHIEKIIDGIKLNPTAPEYWWIYSLLLSSMLPSFINLIIGGTSLLRGIPGLSSLLLRKIPARGNVIEWDRAWIATVLTGQVAAGAVLGISAQVLLALGLIGHVMPFFGLELLDMARNVAALNLPEQVFQLLAELF